MMNKPVHQRNIYMSPKHKADSRAPGSGQHLELGMSEKEGDQESASASGHGQGTGRQSCSSQQRRTRQQEGCAAFLSPDCKRSSSLTGTTQGSGTWHTATISHLLQAQPPASV